ncbi:MAG: LysR family transcriptional regulator [Acidobacteriaceae bacterium]|nr:LysR family transcriptional regulator [Acidobacteriaceae bacterium]
MNTVNIHISYVMLGLVNLANLRLIRDIAHYKSVSKAAHANEVSQSAASQALQELERELATELFDRTRRPLAPTPSGKLALEFGREVLRRYDDLQADLAQLKQAATGTVRLAAIYSVGLSEMSRLEERFGRDFPEAELQVSYLRPERVWDAVADDQADVGLMSYAESSRDIVALPWRDEEMVVAVSPQHPLAHRRKINISALEGENFIGFDDDLPIQSHIDRYLRDHKVKVETTLRFDNLQMIKEAVAHQAGISIMPKRVMQQEVSQGRLVALRLDPAELYRPVRIVHRRRKAFTNAMSGFLDILRAA